MQKRGNNVFLGRFNKMQVKRKTTSSKLIFAIFCVTVLLISGMSAATISLKQKKEIKEVFQIVEKKEKINPRTTTHHPDISQNKDENYIGNTGFETWYYYIADIVNPANGNLHITQRDLMLPARGWGLGIEIARDYNSHNADYKTMFGYGWTFQYNVYLVEEPDSSVIFVEGDGSFHNFTYNGGTYTSPPGKEMRLKKNLDNSFTLRCCKGKTYNFDSGGTLINVTDKNNNHVNFSYSGDNLVNISDDSGLWVKLDYNGENLVETVTDKLGRQVTYEYDDEKDLRNVTDPMGNTTMYFYCNEGICPVGHHLIGHVDVVGRVATFEHILQPNGLVKLMKIGNSLYDYDTESYPERYVVVNVTYVSGSLVNYTIRGDTTQIQLNSNGNPEMISESDCGCGAIYQEWDEDMNFLGYTNERGYSWDYEYDEYGNIANETNPLGHKTSYKWETVDSGTMFFSFLRNVTDLRGSVTSYGYDSLGNKINMTDVTGSITNYTYDSYGSMISEQDARGYYTNYTYDIHGNPHNKTDSEGEVSNYTYDEGRRLINYTDSNGYSILYEYDSLNRLIKITDTLGNTTEYEFNAIGDIVNITDERDNTITLNNNFMNQVDNLTDPTGNKTRYTYDNVGNLIEFTDFAGNVTKYYYDDLNKLIEIKDSQGNSEKYDYDEVGNQIEFIDRSGNITTYEYDPLNRLIGIVYPGGQSFTRIYDDTNNTVVDIDEECRNITTYYDDLGRFSKKTDTDGEIISLYEYDDVGNIIGRTNAGDQTIIYDFNNVNLATTVTDALGNSSYYEFDGEGNLLKTTDPRGYEILYEYDGLNRLINMTDPYGNYTLYEYDAKGNVVNETDARGYTMSFEYDSLNRLVKFTNALGDNISYEYDALGNMIKMTNEKDNFTTFDYDELGRLIKTTDSLGYFTSNEYDSRGNLIKITDKRGFSTQYNYDELNRLIAVEKADYNTVSYGYDRVGNVISYTNERGYTTQYLYDDLNRMINMTDATGNSTLYEYDDNGNVISITDPNDHTWTYDYDGLDRLIKITSPLGYETRNSYDKVGNLINITDANGNSTNYEYDGLNRLIAIKDAMGYYTNYTFDEISSIVQITDANNYHTNYSYDPLNRLIQMEKFGHQTNYTYDPCGNTINRADANHNTTLYDYDELNRLKTRTYPDGTGSTYEYDENGNVLHINRFDAAMPGGTPEYDYIYDQMNRAEHISFNDDMGYVHLTSFAYTQNGNLERITYPFTAEEVIYNYDEIDRIQQITDLWGDTTNFTYDNAGRRMQLEYPNEVTTSYNYNEDNYLTDIWTNSSTESSIAYYGYSYDPVGNRISETSLDTTEIFEYDDIYRLTSVDTTYPDASNEIIDYTYDNIGNRLSKIVQGGPTTSYTYENNLIKTEGTGGFNTYSFTYDNNGNLIQRSYSGYSDLTNYEHDYENRLTKYQRTIAGFPDSIFNNVTYGYTSLGDRMFRDNETTPATYYSYAFEDVIQEYDYFGSPNNRYIHGPGIDEPLILKHFDTSDKNYYHHDALGSITEVTNQDETLVATYDYEPFGATWDETGTLSNPYQFTGREYDDEAGMYYYRARYYNPYNGRFITEDPRIMSAGSDLYVYVNNNPVNFIDPLGLQQIQIRMPSNRIIYNTNTFEYSNQGIGPVWFASGSNNVQQSINAGFTGGLSYPDWNPKPKGKKPEYDGKCTCHNECCCWITKPGEFKFTYGVKYTQPGPQNAPGQQGTFTLDQSASDAINAHEDEHVRLAKIAHDIFIGPLMQRVKNYMGRKNAMKAGSTVEECIQKLKAFIRWDAAINKFLQSHDRLNKAGGVLDAADTAGGSYLQTPPAQPGQPAPNPMPVTARDTQEQQQARYNQLEKDQRKDMNEDAKNSGLDETDNGHGNCVMCTHEPPKPTPTPPPPPPHSPTPVPVPVPYPYPWPSPTTLHPDGYAYSPRHTYLPIYYNKWNDVGFFDPINIHDGDVLDFGDHRLSTTLKNDGDYTITDIYVDYTLERWESIEIEIMYEGFESGIFPPVGWLVHNTPPPGTDWMQTTNPYVGSYAAGVELWPIFVYHEWITTPAYDLSLVDSPYLSFYYSTDITDPFMELQVWASTEGQYPGYFDTLLYDVIVSEDIDHNSYNNPVEIDLASYGLEGETVYIGFKIEGMTAQEDKSVNIDEIKLAGTTDEWQEIFAMGGGPYDLDPDVWIESFFDVFFDTEGEYRATFSLDDPLRGDWSDDYLENDEYQAEFTVLSGFILNLNDFPMYRARSYPPDYNVSQMTGSAVAQMNLDYMWWNSTINPNGPPRWSINNGWGQDDLYEYGHAENDNPGLEYLDARGLWYTIQNLDPSPYSEYGYNFGIYSSDIRADMLAQICLWINYTAGRKPGHPIHVPGAVPAYGDYSNWMSVRGIHTDVPAYPLPEALEVRGFWVNDPYPSTRGGIGENSYKMANEWNNTYYLPINIPGDTYEGKYIAICEPPIAEDCDLTIKESMEYWNLEPPERKDGPSSLQQVDNNLVIHAAREGVQDQLLPYDDDFKVVFEQSFVGRPILIKNLVEDKHDYYAVPFNSIQTLQPIPRGSQTPPQEDITLIVVLIDATTGQFKEASWVHEPVTYLPLSKSDALDIVFEELIDLGYNPDELNTRKIDADLVYRDSTPYYPDWRIIISELGLTFYVNQEGIISN